MRGKQSALLSQLDTLHEECANLRKELFQVEESRLKLANDLKEAQARYEQVQSQLSTQQVLHKCIMKIVTLKNKLFLE